MYRSRAKSSEEQDQQHLVMASCRHIAHQTHWYRQAAKQKAEHQDFLHVLKAACQSFLRAPDSTRSLNKKWTNKKT